MTSRLPLFSRTVGSRKRSNGQQKFYPPDINLRDGGGTSVSVTRMRQGYFLRDQNPWTIGEVHNYLTSHPPAHCPVSAVTKPENRNRNWDPKNQSPSDRGSSKRPSWDGFVTKKIKKTIPNGDEYCYSKPGPGRKFGRNAVACRIFLIYIFSPVSLLGLYHDTECKDLVCCML